jgi:hypothetical protein
MKKTIVSIFAVAVLFIVTQVNAQEEFAALDASPMDVTFFPANSANAEFSGDRVEAKIKLYYSRSQLKGRPMTDLIPADKAWRFGANEASEITFYQNVNIGGTKIKAGTYAVSADVKAGKWTFIIGSKVNTWGNFLPNGNKEIARVEGAVSSNADTVEALSMKFNAVDGGTHLVVGWGNVIAEMPIKF